jgi:acyl-CoA reductase-like NAD-dependent aldehyde dehydrogenase
VAAIIEPATERLLADVPMAGEEEVDEAVARAREAFPGWRDTAPQRRAEVLLAIGRAVLDDVDALAETEARNTGKPIAHARAEIQSVANTFRYYSGAPERIVGETFPVAGGVDFTFREAIGVVGLITPWNFPLPIAAWKVAPALAAGNAVVLKPAELTPLTSLRLHELVLEAGLPEHVLNVVAGRGDTAGRRLVGHPDVGKIGFTGSTVVGREIAARAAEQIKRVTLELGGKSANIVFADADLERACAEAPGAVYDNAGQDCCARSRILVEESVADEFIAGFAEAAGRLRVGGPFDDGVDMGPLISAHQRDRVASFLDDEVTVAFQGAVPEGPGYWFPPTLVVPGSRHARVVSEEVFGPVAAVLTFRDEAEAIALANQSIYGLSGSIWTRDGAKAMRVARAVQTGTLSVNSNSSVRVHTPFGGFKESGLGRELGPQAIEAYTELKNVFVATA